MGWAALVGSLALAIGGGVVTDDLHVLIGDRAHQVVAAARIVAALVAAATGAVVVKRNAGDDDAAG